MYIDLSKHYYKEFIPQTSIDPVQKSCDSNEIKPEWKDSPKRIEQRTCCPLQQESDGSVTQINMGPMLAVP